MRISNAVALTITFVAEEGEDASEKIEEVIRAIEELLKEHGGSIVEFEGISREPVEEGA